MNITFGHICLLSPHLEILKEFYTGKLGLQEKWAMNNDAGALSGYCVTTGNGVEIEMFSNPNALPDSGRIAHFCLVVDSIAQAREWLVGKEIVITKQRDNVELWIKDPDGNEIEFVARKM